MKRIAFPVLSAIICLQILSGCRETSQSSNVRVAGKSAAENAKIAAKSAQDEASIKEEELNLSQVKAYGDIVEFILNNIRGRQSDTFGMEDFVKSRNWRTISLKRKNPDSTVLATTRAETGKIGYVAFQTAKTVFIDATSFNEAEEVEKAKIILRQIVTGLRLKAKGMLNGDTLSGEGSLSDSEQAQLDEARDVLDEATKSQTGNQSVEDMPSDASIVGSSIGDEMGQEVGSTNKKESIQAKIRLDANDMEGIRVVTEFLMVRGNSATLEEIKEQLVKYKIIK